MLDAEIATMEQELGGKAACERYLHLLERAGRIDRTKGSFLIAVIKQYIRHVGDCEGVDFLTDTRFPDDTSSDEGMALLQTLSREVFEEDHGEYFKGLHGENWKEVLRDDHRSSSAGTTSR